MRWADASRQCATLRAINRGLAPFMGLSKPFWMLRQHALRPMPADSVPRYVPLDKSMFSRQQQPRVAVAVVTYLAERGLLLRPLFS
jgi:hypothetical protein